MAEILVVEDRASFREALADTLADAGYSVRMAANGAQGLAAFAEKRPDLVLLDVMMPGRDGYSVCAEMRAKDPLIPILMLTAKNAERDKVRGLQRGADDYIDKTVGTQELLARIGAALRRAGAVASKLPAEPAKLGPSFMIGSHRVDGARYRLIDARGREKVLMPREVRMLRFLAEHRAIPDKQDVLGSLRAFLSTDKGAIEQGDAWTGGIWSGPRICSSASWPWRWISAGTASGTS